MRGKAGNHPRNTGPMHASPRCGARTRKGAPCQAPAVNGKARCRMHGGARGSGAPIGNTNALKHGLYTRAALEERRALRSLIREMQESLQEIEGG
jgi:glucans biosynthesis protein